MKITITVFTGSSAFGSGVEDLCHELSRILSGCPDKVAEQLSRPDCLCDHPEAADVLLDINGNNTGSIVIIHDHN